MQGDKITRVGKKPGGKNPDFDCIKKINFKMVVSNRYQGLKGEIN